MCIILLGRAWDTFIITHIIYEHMFMLHQLYGLVSGINSGYYMIRLL